MPDPGPRRESIVRNLLVATLIALLGGLLAMMRWDAGRARDRSAMAPAAPAAPPELARFAERFRAGVAAFEGGEAARAIELLSSFEFGSRPVEEYRLYYLANAQHLAGRTADARTTLARLWASSPALVRYPEVAFNLGGLYLEVGAVDRAAEVFGALATRSPDPAIAATARERYVQAKFRAGDLGAVLLAAHNIVVENPATEQAVTAAAVIRSLRGLPDQAAVPLTVSQRIRRAEALLSASRPKAALDEISDIDPAALPRNLHNRHHLAMGEALHRTGRHEESEAVLEPLFPSLYRYAIPALRLSARNRRALTDAADPVEVRTVKVRERAGTRVVTRKGKRVRVPNYRTVTRRVERIDPAKKAAHDRHEAVWLERLHDLRSLPIPPELRREVLEQLVAHALRAKDDARLRSRVRELVEIDPANDTALQHFWDRGWEAWTHGDLARASDLFNFIASTYRNPNIRRQSAYWFARAVERRGKEAAAREIYAELASAPYDDLYALFARERLGLARPAPQPASPAPRISWEELAEEQMPDELRLAWELDALGIHRDARLEVQRNLSFDNRKWADSILGDLYFIDGSLDLAYRYLRRAWPELATPEQNAVPWRFLEMYYPIRFEREIRQAAEKNRLDPYLLMALIRQESAFNPDARSHAGAIGLMQLMPATGRELGNRLYSSFTEARLSNPEVNIELGSHYLRRVLDLFGGNVELALAGYNGGPYRILRWRRGDPSRPLDEFLEGMALNETRNYVKRITLLRSSYQRLYGTPPAAVDAPSAGGAAAPSEAAR